MVINTKRNWLKSKLIQKQISFINLLYPLKDIGGRLPGDFLKKILLFIFQYYAL